MHRARPPDAFAGSDDRRAQAISHGQARRRNGPAWPDVGPPAPHCREPVRKRKHRRAGGLASLTCSAAVADTRHVARYNSIYFNAHSSLSARLSAGNTLALVEAVSRGMIKNGFAIVRPPGHHAEQKEAMGFCLYNNVAIAAKLAQKEWGIERYGRRCARGCDAVRTLTLRCHVCAAPRYHQRVHPRLGHPPRQRHAERL